MPKQSKRTPLRRKYSIERKVKEHNRKAKRAAKANPGLRRKLRKDPGIPNLNPFKAQILSRLSEQQKLLKFESVQRARRAQEVAARRRAAGEAGAELDDAEDGGLAGLAADAAARGREFASASSAAAEAVAADGGPGVAADPAAAAGARAGSANRRAFYRQLKALLDKADVLLEVLDARDPAGCRSPALEALALSMSPPKKIVLVLNKCDLVPPPVVRAWLAALRREFPTVPFKASTQHQRDNLSARGGGAINKALEAGEVLTGAGAAGTDTLLQLLKNYSRSTGSTGASAEGGGDGGAPAIKTALTVGCVGFPNVGKSSVINSLKRSRAVGVSATAGSTRSLQEVAIDGKITVIDSPGVIFDDGDAGSGGGNDGLLLKNVLSVDAVEDPEGAVSAILARCRPEALMALYAIPAFDDAAQFLGHIALRRGKLGRGGVPNRTEAARSVLQDWQQGRIPFFVTPPGFSWGGGGDDEDGEEAQAGDEDMGGSGAGSSSSSSAAAAGGKKGKKGAAAAAASGLGRAAVSRDVSDVGAVAILGGNSKAAEQPAFDLEGLFAAADAAMLGGSSAGASSSGGYLAVPSAAGGSKLSASASAAAAGKKLAAKVAAAEAGEPLSDEEDDEDDDEEDEEMDDDDDDEEGDDDDMDEDDDEEEDDDDDEEEDDAPPPPPARKGAAAAAAAVGGKKAAAAPAARIAGAAALRAVAGGKAPAPAAAAGKKKASSDAYDFNEHFR